MPTLEEVEAEIEQDNRKIRAEFVALIPCLSFDEVADMIEPPVSNKAAMIAEWKATRAIFSVEHDESELFPAFQFLDRHPNPVIAPILAALDPDLSRWNIALWWVAGNGWLRNAAAPADCLDEPVLLRETAMRTRERFIG